MAVAMWRLNSSSGGATFSSAARSEAPLRGQAGSSSVGRSSSAGRQLVVIDIASGQIVRRKATPSREAGPSVAGLARRIGGPGGGWATGLGGGRRETLGGGRRETLGAEGTDVVIFDLGGA